MRFKGCFPNRPFRVTVQLILLLISRKSCCVSHRVVAPPLRGRATTTSSRRSSHHFSNRPPRWALARGGGDASASKSNDKQSSKGHASERRDDFVQAAPLIVAVVCRDGVAIVAAHTRGDEEILLYNHNFFLERQRHQQQQRLVGQNDQLQEESSSIENHDDTPTPAPSFFQDLPGDFHGPFRIQSIDTMGTTVVATGWRADCDHVTSVCQRLASRKADWLGKGPDPYHGHVLATDLSLYMAQLALSGGRSLSCATLLVAPSPFGNARNRSLFLVDATGSYPVRALALGGGMTVVKDPISTTATMDAMDDKDSENSRHVAVADEVNRRLSHVDFSNLSAKQGLERVLTLLSGKQPHNAAIDKLEGDHPTLLAHETRLELAVAYFDKQSLTRLSLSSLLKQQSSSLIQ